MARRGRPTKLTPKMAARVFILARKGLTNKEIAVIVEVDEDTITNWKNRPDFFGFIKRAKKVADFLVERSLFERAVGYDHPEDKIFNAFGVTTTVPTTKHYPPDVLAQIFWLKNRNRKLWRDKQDVEHSGEIQLTMVEALKSAVGKRPSVMEVISDNVNGLATS